VRDCSPAGDAAAGDGAADARTRAGAGDMAADAGSGGGASSGPRALPRTPFPLPLVAAARADAKTSAAAASSPSTAASARKPSDSLRDAMTARFRSSASSILRRRARSSDTTRAASSSVADIRMRKKNVQHKVTYAATDRDGDVKLPASRGRACPHQASCVQVGKQT
jgi:hypothetical protein